MFEGFKATKAERDTIRKAFSRLCDEAHGGNNRFRQCANDERYAYGNKSDRVPELAAQGLICSWFVDGFNCPDALLRDHYWIRPAAVYAQGFGASLAAKNEMPAGLLAELQAAVKAYEAAFARMHDATVAAFRKAAA